MKDKIIYFVVGAIIAIFCVHAYIVYQLRDQTIQNSIVIQQIVNLINGSATTTKK